MRLSVQGSLKADTKKGQVNLSFAMKTLEKLGVLLLLGLAGHPFDGEGLQIAQTLEQV